MWTLLEGFGYRQLTVFWRLQGIFKFLRGRTDWGKMERRGFQAGGTPAASSRRTRVSAAGASAEPGRSAA